jgi:integrase
MKLSDRNLRKMTDAELGGKSSRKISAGDGLVLLLKQNRGSLRKLWQVRVMIDGKDKAVQIGQFLEGSPDHLSVDQARAAALVARERLAAGLPIDPADENPHTEMTLDELCTEFRDFKVNRATGRWGAKSLPNLIRDHVQEHPIAKLKLHELTAKTCSKHVHNLYAKGYEDNLCRVIWINFKGMLKYAVDQDYIERNPMSGDNPYTATSMQNRKRKIPLTDEQITYFVEGVYNHRCRQSNARHYRFALLMMLATGLRAQEVARLRWSYIKRKGGMKVLEIPGRDNIDGKQVLITKNGRDLTLPVTDWMQTRILNVMEPMTKGKSKWMFPHSSEWKHGYAKTADTPRSLRGITERGNTVVAEGDYWRPHSLRATLATRMADIAVNAPDALIKSITNHKDATAHERYQNNEYLPQKLLYLSRWHACIDLICNGQYDEFLESMIDKDNDPMLKAIRKANRVEPTLKLVVNNG